LRNLGPPSRGDEARDGPHPLHWVNFLECPVPQQADSEIETCVRSSAARILGNLSLHA